MKLDHVGIAVESLKKALPLYEGLGLELKGIEEVAEQKVKVATFSVGEGRIELLEPLDADSPVGRFLAKKGAGIHHIAVKVDDIGKTLSKLKEKGVELIDEEPGKGADGCLIAFIHPRSAGGVLIELTEKENAKL